MITRRRFLVCRDEDSIPRLILYQDFVRSQGNHRVLKFQRTDRKREDLITSEREMKDVFVKEKFQVMFTSRFNSRLKIIVKRNVVVDSGIRI